MLLNLLLSVASAASPLPPLPEELREIEAKYAKAATLYAEFNQVTESAALKQQKKSSGTIQIKRPDKLRWEETAPEKTLLVSDGKTFWFYTYPIDAEDRGQLVERKVQEIQSKLANQLLSGAFSKAKGLKIERKSTSEFWLTPKKGSAGTVERATLLIDPDKKLIQKVILENQGGNRSEITLNKIELGKALGDDQFKFSAPPNTDRIKD